MLLAVQDCALAPLAAASYHSDKAEASISDATSKTAQMLEQLQATQMTLKRLTWAVVILAFLFLAYLAYMHWIWAKKEVVHTPEQPATNPPPIPSVRPQDMSDEDLFKYIDAVVRHEHLYQNPLLDRQVLMTRLGLSARRIGAAFAQGSTYQSLPKYIRQLRLEHASGLLLSSPELSVNAVGKASGFSNISTFCSDFKNYYGCTPSDFRQNNSGKNN